MMSSQVMSVVFLFSPRTQLPIWGGSVMMTLDYTSYSKRVFAAGSGCSSLFFNSLDIIILADIQSREVNYQSAPCYDIRTQFCQQLVQNRATTATTRSGIGVLLYHDNACAHMAAHTVTCLT